MKLLDSLDNLEVLVALILSTEYVFNKIRMKILKKIGRTRIRTGVNWIKTNCDNHYTIQPIVEFSY